MAAKHLLGTGGASPLLFLNRWRHPIVLILVVCLIVIGIVVALAHRTGPEHPVVVPTVTTAPTTTSTTAQPSTTTTGGGSAAPPAPIKIPGGTMVVVGGNVTLTTTVVHGESLWLIAGWFDQMGGWQAVYALNKSVVGANPNLIFAGEILNITVPAADIPKISPAWLALTKTR